MTQGTKSPLKLLATSDADYRTIFDTLSDAILVHDACTGDILQVNRKMCEMFGYTPEEARQLNVLDLCSVGSPCNYEKMMAVLRKAHSGEPQLFQWLAKDSAELPFWVEVHLKHAVIGGEARALAVIRDITGRREMQQALAESEARFRTVTESSLAGVYLIQDDKFRYVNPILAQTFGYRPEEVINRLGPLDMVHPEDRDFVAGNMQRRLSREEEAASTHFRGLTKDGRTIFCQVLTRYAEYQGRPAIMGTLLDVTASQLAQEALQLSEERYRIVTECSLAGVYLVQDDLFRYVNPMFAQIFGYRRVEIIDRLSPADLVYPEDRPLVTHNLIRRLKGEAGFLQYSFRGLCQDGSVIHVEVLGRRGEYQGRPAIIGTLMDITARRRAEEAIQAHRALLKTIFSATPDLLVLKDRDSIYQAVNPAFCEFLGKSEEEIVGKTAFDLFPLTEADMFRRDDLRVVTTGLQQVKDEEVTGVHGKKWFQGIKTPVVDEKGEITGILSSVRDITDRKQAEAQLRRRDAVLEAVAVAGEKLLSAGTWKENIQEILRGLGEATGVSHAHIFEKCVMDKRPAAACLRYTWSAPNPTPPENPQGPGVKWQAWGHGPWADFLGQADIVFGKEQEFLNHIQEQLAAYPSGCTLAVPILVGSEVWGALCFQDCLEQMDWSAAEVDTLRTAANILGAVMQRKRVEEALRASETNYQTIFNAVNDSIAVVDSANGNFLEVNQKFTEMTGFSRDEALGLNVAALFQETSPYNREDALALVFKTIQEGPQLFEWLAQTRDGSSYWVEVSLKLTQIGGQDRILAVVRDISERKLAEAALKESEQQLRLLTSQLLHAQESERRRLSRELHDELGQALTVLKIHLGAIDNKLRKDQQQLKGDCEHLLNHLNNIIVNVRRLSWDLCPTILEDLGLSSALRHLIDETCANHDMACSIELDEIDHLFSPEAKTHIYRFFQEALNNLSKHSQATFFSAKVTRQDDQVSFTLVDNGRGFEVDQAQSQNVREKRLGLTTMNERARMAGGFLHIWSRPGTGARLTFTLPTDKKRH